MNSKGGLKAMKDFAAEHGLQRQTVGDIVAIHKLPYQRIGNAKGLDPKTQRTILRILGIKPARATA